MQEWHCALGLFYSFWKNVDKGYACCERRFPHHRRELFVHRHRTARFMPMFGGVTERDKCGVRSQNAVSSRDTRRSNVGRSSRESDRVNKLASPSDGTTAFLVTFVVCQPSVSRHQSCTVTLWSCTTWFSLFIVSNKRKSIPPHSIYFFFHDCRHG